MKQKLLYLLPLSTILLVSCSDLVDSLRNDVDSSDGVARIYASFSQEEVTGTRTSLGVFNGLGFPYQWNHADAIGVFSVGEKGVVSTTNAIFKYDASINEEVASFIGTPQILKYDDIWAYYPWGTGTTVKKEGGRNIISLLINQYQNYNFSAVPENPTPGLPSGSFGQGEAPAVAWGQINVAADNTYTFDLSFKPVAAYLTIPIVGEAIISSVGISVEVGEDNPEYVQLAGTLNIDMSKGETGLGNPGFNGDYVGYATIDSPGTPENGGLITIDCGRGIQLDPENPTWFWFVVPANMPTTTDTKVTIYVNGNPEFLYTFNRSNNASPIGRNQTIGLSSRNPFVYEESDIIPCDMELAFPDPIFREYILSNFDTDKDRIITEEEALFVTSINVYGMEINSLQGIRYFANLTELQCSNNNLRILNLSRNTKLNRLYCHSNDLNKLDLSNNTNLSDLDCTGNNLSSLYLTNNKYLGRLICSGNQLTSLDLSNNTNLSDLDCSGNKLSSLDLTNNKDLGRLICWGNQLTFLDLSNNIELEWLECGANLLTNLNVSNLIKLTTLNCGENKFTSLKINDLPKMTTLWCERNKLESLDLSNLPELTNINCTENELRNLKISGLPKLTTLDCDRNKLESLDLSNLPELTNINCSENELTNLDFSDFPELTNLSCWDNKLTTITLNNLPKLTELVCGLNAITTLEVNNLPQLTLLDCSGNNLTSLNINDLTHLEQIGCADNQLTSLTLSNLPELKFLHCSQNKLRNMEVSTLPQLFSFYCEDNQLTYLDLSYCSQLQFLNCAGNQLSTLDVSHTSLNPSIYSTSLYCNMATLKILYLKKGWEIEGINVKRSEKYIYPTTQIEYKE